MDSRWSGSRVLAFDNFSMLPHHSSQIAGPHLLSASSGPNVVSEYIPTLSRVPTDWQVPASNWLMMATIEILSPYLKEEKEFIGRISGNS